MAKRDIVETKAEFTGCKLKLTDARTGLDAAAVNKATCDHLAISTRAYDALHICT